MSESELIRSIEKMIRQYGFVITSIDYGNKIWDYLRNANLAHLFRINKAGNFIILEPNVLLCEHECNAQCHNHNGYRDNECFSECVYTCRENRFEVLLSRIGVLP
ncbi:hypothetical protein QPL79_00240 [Ignisphaera sp. 4213-co]|uniref:Uncharacterized protein n=1 Tax=Ignisphaera cupida TaxID=3050454 RepID=A0ABD4Z3A2_9CREN|nr:hypothetical protein [Ignisphaera sp. 4213-co]MDK6027802.1 hypothetical protein [Ignisphaera sp. 4213-co]